MKKDISLQSNQRKPYKFIPSLSVTVPVFSKLLMDNISFHQLVDQPHRMSKTASITLYCYFSSLINRYLYSLNKEEQDNFKKELGKDT